MGANVTIIRTVAAVADIDGFQVLYAACYPRVVRYCYRIVRDDGLAWDITQESFARLYVRWARVSAPEGYVFRTATNLALSALRRAKHDTVVADAAVLAGDRHAPGPGTGHHALHLAVHRLPRRYRELVVLHYFADLPLAELGAALDRPVGTLKRQLLEARRLLAAELDQLDV